MLTSLVWLRNYMLCYNDDLPRIQNMQCGFDLSELNETTGTFHCPECGEVITLRMWLSDIEDEQDDDLIDY